MSGERPRMREGWSIGRPPADGLYERQLTDELTSIDEYRDGAWRYQHSGRLCGLQSKPWRPVEKVKA